MHRINLGAPIRHGKPTAARPAGARPGSTGPEGIKKADASFGTGVGGPADLLGPGPSWRRASDDPVLILRLRLRLRQPLALVLYVDGHLGQRRGVLAGVVSAEKQLSRVSQQHADVCLGAATIADVQRVQRLGGGYCSSQRRLPRVMPPASTSVWLGYHSYCSAQHIPPRRRSPRHVLYATSENHS
jgi:hypothetical protein